MSPGGQAPPVQQKHRMVLRIVAVAVAYFVYLFLESAGDGGLVPAVIAGVGTLLLGFVLVDRYTLQRTERSGLIQVGTTILALGLIVIGAGLALR